MFRNVYLILFFDIYKTVKTSKYFKIVDESICDQIDNTYQCEATSTDCEVQTELHPTPSNKDEKYVWNLWDYRRKAIELVRRFQ